MASTSAALNILRDAEGLFRPFRLNKLQLPNRLVMAPMGRNFSVRGVPGEGYLEYFRKRVEGGIGLCIGEASAVNHPVASSDDQHADFHGDALRMWRRIVETVHAAGGLFMPQIWHAGLLRGPGAGAIPNADRAPMGPSGWALPLVHRIGWINPIEKPQQLSPPMLRSDIDAVIDAFGAAAADAQAIGADGVQIHAAHGYLIDSFFWERMNFRDDVYGGDLVSRTRFAAELVAECRRRVGRDFPILFRWSQWKQQDYHVKLAPTPQVLERFLRPLTDAGVDLFDCSTRRFWEPEFEHAGSSLNLAGWTKKLTGKPTMTVGSVGLAKANFVDEEAFSMSNSGLSSIDTLLERIAADEFDLVAIGRALITNPDWPRRVRSRDYASLQPYDNSALNSLA
jgi:2,4-dienoyl-CoA reductase-like NADH-dependent reductase (Old Yellow Enzyme family)